MKKNARPDYNRPTLRQALRRLHIAVTLFAVGLAGIIVMVMGLFALRTYSDHHQQLIARSIAYTVEAATVFHDRQAAMEILATIAAKEDVSSAVVFDGGNEILAEWHHPKQENFVWIREQVARLVNPPPVYTPIAHQGQVVGRLLLVGRGANLFDFLLKGLGGVLACVLVSGLIASWLSRRTSREIVRPLRTLAEVAHAVRNERAFARRVPPARIQELHALGEDFNALLDELEAWQTQWLHENASLAHKAAHDSLTGLPNRAHFEEQLDRAIHDAAVLDRRVAIMFLDSDRFKEINDGMGHAAGDAVLINIAARVRGQLREGDVVARLGGDEFAVMLSPLRELSDAQRIADDILLGMRAPIRLPNGEDIICSLSIGIAVYPDHAGNPTDLFDAADSAMYRAKRRGGGTQSTAGRRGRPSREIHTAYN
ncbi:diguanylate cyclase [Bordetella genomosp. 9]|uniref:Diguanylate cyclase n=1 Tax=Bordetella genomosp. 9 TaxID=1416803 RepID=A0A261RP49_9BORD|nr:diguanylate cyclase [Bordetella genomosp. 9]OZI26557.1 diguanylate cyclase [Bordetella genomosp. 9]